MSAYVDFPEYDELNITKYPTQSAILIRGVKYILEVSCNKMTDTLFLKVYKGTTSNVILAGKAIVAGIDLMLTVPSDDFPSDVAIYGSWLTTTPYHLRKAFMKDFRIYVGGA